MKNQTTGILAGEIPYQLLADGILVLHVAVAAFIVGGLAAIITGNLLGWRQVNALWFRRCHLGAIAVVVLEAWLGATCPLTTLEMWLRTQARAGTYSGSFIEYWLQRLLYFEAPAWVFILAYTLFAVLVAALWRYFPPEQRGGRGVGNRQKRDSA